MTETLKRLPLHDAHAAAGARFAPFAGYEMPVRYGAIKDEHFAVRARAGLFDVSHMGEVFVRGPDAVAAVDHLITNNLSALPETKALYTVMCREDGGIVDDLIVYKLAADEVLICVNAANREKDARWIHDHLQGRCTATDESDDWCQLAVQGPRAVDVVAAVCGPETRDVPSFHARWSSVSGHRALLARTGYTGEDGFEVYVPSAGARPLFDALVTAGAPRGLLLAGLGARDTLRLEARLPLYGNDIDDTTNPLEAGLGWVVKFEGRDFIGKGALERVKAAGVRRRLRGLILAGPGVLRRGYPVFAGDRHVGDTTSGGVAPSLSDASIALAYLDADVADLPEVDVEIRGKRVPARTTNRPFYTRPT